MPEPTRKIVRWSVLNYMAPPEFITETVENRLHAMLIVGSFGSGKTTWTISKIAQAIQHLLDRGVDENQVCFVHALGAPISRIVKETKEQVDLGRLKYLYFFNDDAPSARGQHGYRSMSTENIAESQFYIMLRHRLKELGFKGFIFVAHATQIYNIIDTTFRRLSKLKVFKDYPEEPRDKKLIGLMLGKAYFRKLNEISMKIWSPQTQEDLVWGLERAVAKFMGYKAVVRARKMDIPKNVQQITLTATAMTTREGTVYRPVLTYREFAKIMRSSGVKAGERKLLEAWHNLMARLGGELAEEESQEKES